MHCLGVIHIYKDNKDAEAIDALKFNLGMGWKDDYSRFTLVISVVGEYYFIEY